MKDRRQKDGRDPFLHTMGFVIRQWRRQPGYAALIALGVLAMAGIELALPMLAGHLIDILTSTITDRDATLRQGLWVLAAMVGLGALVVALRQGVFMVVIAFTLRMMSAVAREAFARVQRLSTEWHANAFAGSTVRKISRGMWAFDILNDTVLVALWPACIVLLGASVIFALQWPLMGLAVALGSAVYIAATVWLAMRYITPAARLSNQWDSRFGGALADSVTSNAVVKAFGAEDREEARLVRVIDRWRNRTRVMWLRATNAGTTQNVILVGMRLMVIGMGLLFWWQGLSLIHI